jgi:hypothetical protein
MSDRTVELLVGEEDIRELRKWAMLAKFNGPLVAEILGRMVLEILPKEYDE